MIGRNRNKYMEVYRSCKDTTAVKELLTETKLMVRDSIEIGS